MSNPRYRGVRDKSETVLIESVLAGDIDSFGELGRRYWPAMVAIAYAVLGDHHLAEDAAQEALTANQKTAR